MCLQHLHTVISANRVDILTLKYTKAHGLDQNAVAQCPDHLISLLLSHLPIHKYTNLISRPGQPVGAGAPAVTVLSGGAPAG